MHLCRSSSSIPRLPSFLEALQNPQVWLTSNKAQNPSPLLGKTTNDPGVRLPFWLRHVLRATAAYTFWTAQLPKVLSAAVLLALWLRNVFRAACNFWFLIPPDSSTPAALASLPFDPPAPDWEKHSASHLFYPFARVDLLCTCFSLTLATLFFKATYAMFVLIDWTWLNDVCLHIPIADFLCSYLPQVSNLNCSSSSSHLFRFHGYGEATYRRWANQKETKMRHEKSLRHA